MDGGAAFVLGFLERFAFEPVGPSGVYESRPRWGGAVRLILLNELANEAQNAPLKCFSSRHEERKKAFETIKHAGLFRISVAFERTIAGLRRLLMKGSLHDPEMEGITPEDVSQLGKEWLDWLVDVTPDEKLASLPKFGHLLVQGRQEERCDVLLQILHRRFPDLPAWVRQKVLASDLDALRVLTDRAIDACSLQDVFGIEETRETI
ncbi:MAG: DUF4351 domain-containing protein [Magnetococcus sp. DMHC-1]|nr:hypothetical protein [Magnetococcales bacterium]